MTTNEFLDTLSADQLDYAMRRAEELIKRKKEETMVPLWVVEDDCLHHAWFTMDQYPQAVDRLCEEIRKEAEKRGPIVLEFMLMKRRYAESEVAELLAS